MFFVLRETNHFSKSFSTPNWLKLIIFLLLTFSIRVKAQELSVSSEEKQIEETVLKYIECFLIKDTEQLQHLLHPDFTRGGISLNGKISFVYNRSSLNNLMEFQRAFPREKHENHVSSIKLDKDRASAILITHNQYSTWKEYISLRKVEDRWLVLNVFWSYM